MCFLLYMSWTYERQSIKFLCTSFAKCSIEKWCLTLSYIQWLLACPAKVKLGEMYGSWEPNEIGKYFCGSLGTEACHIKTARVHKYITMQETLYSLQQLENHDHKPVLGKNFQSWGCFSPDILIFCLGGGSDFHGCTIHRFDCLITMFEMHKVVLYFVFIFDFIPFLFD